MFQKHFFRLSAFERISFECFIWQYLPELGRDILKGQVKGRVVVDVNT